MVKSTQAIIYFKPSCFLLVNAAKTRDTPILKPAWEMFRPHEKFQLKHSLMP